MSSSLEKLFFQIKLIDELTAPASKLKGSLVKIGNSWRTCVKEFSLGGAVVARTASALHNLSLPAREFSKALGEVESLGVAKEELDKLAQASRDFTAEFGGDAVEIARSAYDIQSAIPGLGRGALAAFTTRRLSGCTA